MNDLVGFDIYRQVADSDQVRLNDVVIPPTDTIFVDVPSPREETRYWMVVESESGLRIWYGPVYIEAQLMASALGIVPSLSQNVPNPAHAGERVSIKFSIAKEGMARLEVFDLAGRRVTTLQNSFHSEGNYSANWDGKDERGIPISPGVYFYRLESADGLLSRKLLIMR